MTPGPSDWLTWGGVGGASPDMRDLEARLRRLGWRRHEAAVPVWSGQAGPPVADLGPAGVLIGRFHPRPPPLPPGMDPRTRAERLMAEGWGRWVAVLPWSGGVAVVRDPSGGLDALVWRQGPLWVAASDAHPGLDDLLPSSAEIDIGKVGVMLAHPAAVSGAPAVRGLEAAPPGGGLILPAVGAAQSFQIWTPARAARRSVDPQTLADAVEEAVRIQIEPHARFVGEISGGFDSAVVATSAIGLGLGDRACAWLNFHAAEREGDERIWARAIAARAGLTLTERPKIPSALRPEDLTPLVRGVRPALQGLDVEYDREVADRLRSENATALLTGQGGDAVFFQYGTPAVATDRVRRLGLRGLDPAFLHRTARWTRRSAWTVAAAALGDRFEIAGRAEAGEPEPPAADVHPWLADLQDLPPARRGQVRQLVNAQIFHGDCLRARAAELLHPLLSQPVMEAGLGIPVDILVEGGRDRDLARRLFADRLPSALLSRRGKGELSTYYGHVVRLSLPFARELLCDGELIRHGLLTREEVEAQLDPAHLIADGAYNLVLIRMVLESWLRGWRDRLSARREMRFEPGQDASVQVDDIGRT